MYELVDKHNGVTTFEDLRANSRKDAVMNAIIEWDRLTDSDQRKRDEFFVIDDDSNTVADVMRGPYEYKLRYWRDGRRYSPAVTWDVIDYFMPAEVFLDSTFIDRDDAVGIRNDGVQVEVYLEGVFIDGYYYRKGTAPRCEDEQEVQHGIQWCDYVQRVHSSRARRRD